jgi:FKBP-type peptidyl-prolyl cis-trans isomerase SlpA
MSQGNGTFALDAHTQEDCQELCVSEGSCTIQAKFFSRLLMFWPFRDRGMHIMRRPRYNHPMTKMIVLPNSYLTLNYRLTLPSGDDYINTFVDRPATVLMGSGQFAPCFEKVLLGLGVGEKRSALLSPDESFGDRKEDLVQWVSLKALKEGRDEDTEFNPGDVIEFNAPGGAQYAGVLQSIDEEGAWFDFNHPLAGRAVTFEAEIVAIL